MSVHAATPQKLQHDTQPIVVGPLQDAYMAIPKDQPSSEAMPDADAVESNKYSLPADFIPLVEF